MTNQTHSPRAPGLSPPPASGLAPVRIAGGYLVAGLLWVAVGDLVVAAGTHDRAFWAGLGKGAGFVLLSAVLVLTLARRELRAAARSAALLRAVVDEAAEAMFVKDREGRYLLFNAAAARMVGKPVAEVLGRGDETLFGPSGARRVRERDQRVMATGAADTEEETLTAGGVTRTYVATKAPYRDETGAVAGVVGISRDVTESRRAEIALRRSEARLREAQRFAKLGSWAWEPPTGEVWWSEAIYELFGLPPTTAPGLEPFLALLHPDDRAVARARVDGILTGADGFADDLRIVRPDGRVAWIRSEGRAVRDPEGRLLRVEGVYQDVTDRRLADAAARATETRYRELFEANPHPMWAYDRETLAFLAVNNAAVAKYGYTRDEFLRMTIADILPSEDVPALRETLAAITDGYDDAGVWRHYLKGGRLIRVRVTSHTLTFAGRPAEVVLALDVTEQLAAEEALRASEERYRRLVEVLPEAVLINAGDRVAYCNPACVQLFGAADADAIVGKSPFDLFAPEYHDVIRDRIRRMRETGDPVSGLEERIVRFDGRVAPVHVVATPIIDAGRPSILVCLRDLSERERAMDLLRSVLGSVGDAILTIDARGTVTSANPATERLFGYTAAELLGGNVSVLMPEPHRSGHDRYVTDYLRTGVAKVIGVGREVEGRRKDGSTFPVELTVSEFRLDGERQFTGVVRDITARRQLEEQFRQAQKMEAVGRLAGGVAHDFNNLLTVINGYSEMVLAGLSVGDPARESLAAVHDAGERAARLTQQLLAFSRKSVVEPKLVDLNELVAESAKLLRRLIGEDVALAVLADPAPVRVVADPGQLEQVLMNLAVNARDAMPTGGRLTVETRSVEFGTGVDRPHPELSPGRYAALRVADTGCGMSEEVRAKVFEPFFTTKGVGKGTGLGLAVVHGVVKQAGGSVAVESGVGAGTTFTVLLPEAAGPAGPAPSGVTRVAPRGTETVLLVEDEEAVRTLVRVVLESQGYTVLAEADGAAAVGVLRSHTGRIDLVVTDVVMPGMSGREVAEAAQATRPGVRVLYMSGYTDDALGRHGLEGEGTRFIQKPFTPLALARRVRAFLDQGS